LPELKPDDEGLVDPRNPADQAGKMQRLLALTTARRREPWRQVKNTREIFEVATH
jgi:hypothetical protein